MSKLVIITDVKHLHDYVIEVKLSNGGVRICDYAYFFSFCKNPDYDKWKIVENFKTVKVSGDGKHIIWGDPDFCGNGGMSEPVEDLFYLWGDWENDPN